MNRSMPLCAVVCATLVAGPLFGAGAETEVVLKGAASSAPVKARSVDVDLRQLPVAPEWEAGDPIKEIPRRSTSRPLFRGEPERTFEEDPLLIQQDSAIAPAIDAAFTTPILNFAGQGYTGVNPPDTVGDAGPSHYIQMINGSGGARMTIYDKSGALVSGPTQLDSLGSGDCASGLGDPIVLWDPLASRWMLSEFSNAGNKMCVYVSKTSNPVTGGWWAYAFQAPSFPDYPHYGVWPDAYYVGTNESSPAVYAFDRAKMLNGQAATFQRFTASSLAGFSFQIVTPADLDGATAPPSGARGIFARHRDDEVHNSGSNNTSQDYLDIFEFHVDWTTPANSTFTGPVSVAMAEIDSSLCGLTSFNCIPQPGSSTTLDPLREVIMNRLQYRNFGSYQSLVGSLVTDVNGADRAGVRWFELRKSGSSWTLAQQGTYSPDATNRWMSSAAMDGSGNLAIGYSVSASSSVYPGIRFAGRLTTDPAGSLPQGEGTLVSGSAANGSNRWGDYSALSVDPSDDCTFWYTTQYSPSSSWATRIGTFKFDACGGTPTPDFSVACSPSSLSAAQGGSASSTCTVTSTGGFNAAVSLSCSGLPSGASCTFSPASVTPPANGSGNSALTVTVAGSTAVGSYNFTVSGVNGATTRTASLSLSVTGTGPGDVMAAFDATLQAPKCTALGRSCDTGAALVLGRASLGPEPNQPNTIADSCADGTSGTFHSDESNDRLKVSTTDGSAFAPGKTVRIDATVWAYSSYTTDKLDLYYAANASSPSWTFITTLTPTAAGAQTLSATYTLPSGSSLQAVRAVFRYQGSAGACVTGSYNDRDDLVFAVDAPPPTPEFSVACSPASLSAAQGGSASSTCTVTSTGGFSSGRQPGLLGPALRGDLRLQPGLGHPARQRLRHQRPDRQRGRQHRHRLVPLQRQRHQRLDHALGQPLAHRHGHGR